MSQSEAKGSASSIRDAFVSYASEDKEVARGLTDALLALGFSVWFDDYELRVGDSLSRKIDEGLRISRCGIVILSHHFFAKNWPQAELGGIKALEKQVLPIWHGIDVDQVKRYSPALADIRATKTVLGMDRVVQDIAEALRHQGAAPAPIFPDRRYETILSRQAAARLGALVSESSPLVEAELRRRNLHPAYFEVTHIPMGDHRWQPLELLRASERSVIRRTGWPLGVVLQRDEARPRPSPSGISAMIYSKILQRSLDYWRLDQDGAYYLARTFGEDNHEGTPPGTVLAFDTRIWRVAEAFEHARSLYQNLGVNQTQSIYFRFRHAGLAGRTLTASQVSRYIRPIPRQSAVAEVVWTGDASLDQIANELRDLVRRVSAELFLMFDFFQLDDSVLDEVLSQYLSSRM